MPASTYNQLMTPDLLQANIVCMLWFPPSVRRSRDLKRGPGPLGGKDGKKPHIGTKSSEGQRPPFSSQLILVINYHQIHTKEDATQTLPACKHLPPSESLCAPDFWLTSFRQLRRQDHQDFRSTCPSVVPYTTLDAKAMKRSDPRCNSLQLLS